MRTFLSICAIALSLASAGYSHYLSRQLGEARYDPSRIKRAIDEGRLAFDVRGLRNEPVGGAYSGVAYTHKATIVTIGDGDLAGLPFIATFSVRRVSGGRPETSRPADDMAVAFITGGYGEVSVPGGARAPDETWAPEVIELRLVNVVPALPVAGKPVSGS